jgi:hypothetical protein
MPTIKQIQENFCAGVMDYQNTDILQHICRNNITPEFRISIYRNTILQNLRHALENTFPAIWKLVGQECADSLAYLFVQDKINLPVNNCLDDWGKKFPKFLQNMKPISHLVYLKDIAQVEWLKHLSYCAKDYQPFDPTKLQKILDNRMEQLRLLFNPTVFLYSSRYFLKDIFDLIEHPDEKDTIDLKPVPCYVVITRHYNHVVIHWVSEEMFNFFSYIKKRFTLIQSYECLLKANPDFDLVAALQFMLKNNLLWKCI